MLGGGGWIPDWELKSDMPHGTAKKKKKISHLLLVATILDSIAFQSQSGGFLCITLTSEELTLIQCLLCSRNVTDVALINLLSISVNLSFHYYR